MTEVRFASDRIRLTKADGFALIELMREARMNAFDETMHLELRAAIASVADDSRMRALIISGTGRAFSAGQDLGERAAAFERGETPDIEASLRTNYNPLVRSLAELPIPVIAAVNGIAYGAGAAIAIACDILIAAQSARFQFGFVNVGLGPDSGASWFLPRLVGHTVAMDLALTGRSVEAPAALSMGLVSRVVPDDELAETATAIAREIAIRSPAAVQAIKRQLRANPLQNLEDALEAECNTQTRLGGTAQYREAVLRFARPKG